jgi:hypothetical protein
MGEALTSIAGVRLRPVYEVIDAQNEEPAPEKSEMSEEELIEMVKDSFDASEVASEEARESEAR